MTCKVLIISRNGLIGVSDKWLPIDLDGFYNKHREPSILNARDSKGDIVHKERDKHMQTMKNTNQSISQLFACKTNL